MASSSTGTYSMSHECMKDKWYGQCCCNCKYRVNDWSHPHTDGLRILNRRGYICSNPELGSSSGWSEHGICEIWTSRPEVTQDNREWFDNRYSPRQEYLPRDTEQANAGEL